MSKLAIVAAITFLGFRALVIETASVVETMQVIEAEVEQ